MKLVKNVIRKNKLKIAVILLRSPKATSLVIGQRFYFEFGVGESNKTSVILDWRESHEFYLTTKLFLVKVFTSCLLKGTNQPD